MIPTVMLFKFTARKSTIRFSTVLRFAAFISLPLIGSNQTPEVLCVVDAGKFKQEIQLRTKETFKALFGSRLKSFPKSLVQHVFSFILVKHRSVNGVQYLQLSMPITIRVLTSIHAKEDETNLNDWVEYPYRIVA